jgi:hypothetical protein
LTFECLTGFGIEVATAAVQSCFVSLTFGEFESSKTQKKTSKKG